VEAWDARAHLLDEALDGGITELTLEATYM